MSVELVWSPQAREDLLDIYVYIGMDNPDAAEDCTPPLKPQQITWHNCLDWGLAVPPSSPLRGS
jgi:hypothetical protein